MSQIIINKMLKKSNDIYFRLKSDDFSGLIPDFCLLPSYQQAFVVNSIIPQTIETLRNNIRAYLSSLSMDEQVQLVHPLIDSGAIRPDIYSIDELSNFILEDIPNALNFVILYLIKEFKNKRHDGIKHIDIYELIAHLNKKYDQLKNESLYDEFIIRLCYLSSLAYDALNFDQIKSLIKHEIVEIKQIQDNVYNVQQSSMKTALEIDINNDNVWHTSKFISDSMRTLPILSKEQIDNFVSTLDKQDIITRYIHEGLIHKLEKNNIVTENLIQIFSQHLNKSSDPNDPYNRFKTYGFFLLDFQACKNMINNIPTNIQLYCLDNKAHDLNVVFKKSHLDNHQKQELTFLFMEKILTTPIVEQNKTKYEWKRIKSFIEVNAPLLFLTEDKEFIKKGISLLIACIPDGKNGLMLELINKIKETNPKIVQKGRATGTTTVEKFIGRIWDSNTSANVANVLNMLSLKNSSSKDSLYAIYNLLNESPHPFLGGNDVFKMDSSIEIEF